MKHTTRIGYSILLKRRADKTVRSLETVLVISSDELKGPRK